MNSDLNAEKSCEEKSLSRCNSASLYPPPRPPRHRRLPSGGHAVEKEQRRSGNQERMFTGSLQESLMRSASHSQDQYYSLISDAMNSNNNRNPFITNQLYQVRSDEYAAVKVPKKGMSSGSCKYMFVVVLVNIALITCLVILIQLFSDWRGGDMDFQKFLRMRGFAGRVLREANFRSVANVLHLKNTEP